MHRLGYEPGSSAEAGWHATLAQAFAAQRGTVCAMCGLGNVGHAPESAWLGYAPHPYSATSADADMLARARVLSDDAYRARRLPGNVAARMGAGR